MTDSLYVDKLEKQNESLKQSLKEIESKYESVLLLMSNSLHIINYINECLHVEYKNIRDLEDEDTCMDCGLCLIDQLKYAFIDDYNDLLEDKENFINEFTYSDDFSNIVRGKELFENTFVVKTIIRTLRGFFLGGAPEKIALEVEKSLKKIFGKTNYKKLHKMASNSEFEYGSSIHNVY
jgi:hypothetical protein